MSISNSYPQQRAALNLDFANSGKLDSRISFSRADSAPSAVHYWSNEKHLSSENMLPYSNDLSHGDWTKARVTVPTANNTAPDGSSTASSVLETAVTDSHTFYDRYTSVASATYTHTVFAKANGRTKFKLYTRDSNATFDLTAVTATTTGMDAVSITAIGSTGWFKCVATDTASNDLGILQIELMDGSSTSYLGDVTKGLYFWGCQVSSLGEQILNPTSGSIHRSYSSTLKSVANAGDPRFEYSPATDAQSDAGSPRGLLIESQATSLITYSEDFSNSFWDKTRLSVDSNVATAPDGALTASALRVDGTAASTHRMRFTYATGGATAQTFSIFAKAGSKSWLALKFDSSGGAFDASIAYFNLASGTTGTVDSGVTATINDCGNGWYRCSVTRTALASATGQIELYVAEADNDVSIDGNSYDHILCWGAQVEANTSAPSSYIKSNSGSSTTKSADSCSVDMSSFYTGGEVSGIVEAKNIGKPYPTFATLTDSTANQRVMVQGSSTASIVETFVVVGGSVVANPNSALTLSSSKVGFRCDTDNFATVVNGGTVATDTSGPQPATMTTLHIGSKQDGNFQVNGHIGRLSLYSVALSNVELQSLTSNP